MSAAPFERIALSATDGAPIPVLRWRADGTPRAVLQIAHGMGEHAGRYAHVARALAATGVEVWASDHRGHGEVARTAGRLGAFGPGGFAAVVDDLAVVTRALRAQVPGTAVILLGHSMGSFAAQRYLTLHGDLVDGVALSGTAALDLRQTAQTRGPFKLQDYNAAFEPARTPFDWLSRDAAMVDAYVADPLCGFTVSDASRRSMLEVTMAAYAPDALARIPRGLALNLFTGSEDPVNGNLRWFFPLAERYLAAGIANVSVHVYGQGRHEMLNETNRDEVIANLRAWIATVTG